MALLRLHNNGEAECSLEFKISLDCIAEFLDSLGKNETELSKQWFKPFHFILRAKVPRRQTDLNFSGP